MYVVNKSKENVTKETKERNKTKENVTKGETYG